MEHIEKIFVSIKFDKEEIEVGELIQDGRSIYFKYHQDFVKRGLEISPLKLKLNTQLNKADSIPFEGLFGVFADSPFHVHLAKSTGLDDTSISPRFSASDSCNRLNRHVEFICFDLSRRSSNHPKKF